jgi:hypothetical protein
MEAKGLRPVTFWLPDTSTAEFREQAEREAIAVASADEEAEINAFIEAVVDWPPDEEVFWNEPETDADRDATR